MKRSLPLLLMLAGLLQFIPTSSAQLQKKATTAAKKKAVVRRYPPVDPTAGDNVDGDDLVIRRAAVEALGPQNGSV
ncbi:MAG TPA: penicillin-binding protein, partial [Verrucomicrobiae bacterium]|nr:penicillin-binding protein [Verrucomicrobiae bacterium]